MHIGRSYSLFQTLSWSRRDILLPLAWATTATLLHEIAGFGWLALPWLPMGAIGAAVAFYLGFKNNASYDRTWEARKIWGAIVNASRSWAFSSRDLVTDLHAERAVDKGELTVVHAELVHRHVAWMDALRHQLRKVKTWEHRGELLEKVRNETVPERQEKLEELLSRCVSADEAEEVLATLNPAAHLLSNQSRRLSELRATGWLDGFGHLALQQQLVELMAQQGKAERIKNFPFPRQYATVNRLFAILYALLVPFGMLDAFVELEGGSLIWLAAPFSAIVSWVFLTTDRIGDWSENPFEGLVNDVPISSMARGIERDIRQMNGETDLPPARAPLGEILY
ncbi:MAG: bestrophin family protein [Sandaracinaceae bacterium]